MEVRQLNENETSGFESERKWLDKILRHFGDEFALKRLPEDIPTLQSLLGVEPETPQFSRGPAGKIRPLKTGQWLARSRDLR